MSASQDEPVSGGLTEALAPTPEERSRFERESSAECLDVISATAYALSAMLSVALILEYLFVFDDEHFDHIVRVLPIQIVVTLGIAYLAKRWELARRHAVAYCTGAISLDALVAGMLLGGVGGFDGPFFYSIYMLPVFVILIPCGLGARAFATIAIQAAFLLGFIPQLAAFEPVRADVTLNSMLIISFVCVALGHRGWKISRSNSVATQRLERAQRQAQAANRQLAERLRNQARRAEALAHELDDAKSSERVNIARDLHDDVGQILVGARMELAMLDRQLESGERPDVDQIDRLNGVMEGLEGSIRGMIRRLRAQREVPDLRRSLDELVEPHRVSKTVLLDIDEQLLVALDEHATGVAFRVVQEGLTNAAKHSDSETLTVRLREHARGVVEVCVEDRGSHGLPDDPLSSGWGLLGLTERVESAGGALELSRDAGVTSLRALLPADVFTQEAAS